MLPPNLLATPTADACLISRSAPIDKVLTSRFNRMSPEYRTKLLFTTPPTTHRVKKTTVDPRDPRYQPVLPISHTDSRHQDSRQPSSRPTYFRYQEYSQGTVRDRVYRVAIDGVAGPTKLITCSLVCLSVLTSTLLLAEFLAVRCGDIMLESERRLGINMHHSVSLSAS